MLKFKKIKFYLEIYLTVINQNYLVNKNKKKYTNFIKNKLILFHDVNLRSLNNYNFIDRGFLKFNTRVFLKGWNLHFFLPPFLPHWAINARWEYLKHTYQTAWPLKSFYKFKWIRGIRGGWGIEGQWFKNYFNIFWLYGLIEIDSVGTYIWYSKNLRIYKKFLFNLWFYYLDKDFLQRRIFKWHNYLALVGLDWWPSRWFYYFYQINKYSLYSNFLNRYILRSIEYWHQGPVILLYHLPKFKEVWVGIWMQRRRFRLERQLRRIGRRRINRGGIRLFLFSAHSGDIDLFTQWIASTLTRLPLKSHWIFGRFLNNLVYNYSYYLLHSCGIKGFWIQIKGKIGRAGSVRSRRLLIGFGRQWWISYNNQFQYRYKTAGTITGVLGVQVWLIGWWL